MNVGVYRGMITTRTASDPDVARSTSATRQAWQQGGASEVPIAVAMGLEPSIEFRRRRTGAKGICEYDVAGSIRGAPVELVKCETVDLYVPPTPRS